MLPPGCPPLYCYARRSPARATIEHFRSICPIALTLDALFEAKAQVPSRPKHVPMKDTDRRSSRTRAVETVTFLLSAGRSEIFHSRSWKCDAAYLVKTLGAISRSILRAFYKPSVQHYVESYSTADGVDGPASVVSPTQCNPKSAFRKARRSAHRAVACHRISVRDGVG